MKKIMFYDPRGLTKATISGQKTMTRREIQIQPPTEGCRLGWGGDNVKEGEYYTHAAWFKDNKRVSKWFKPRYKVGEIVAVAQSYNDIADFGMALRLGDTTGFTNKMFVKASEMPHRIKITGVRAERLQDISDEDCLKEGLNRTMSEQRYYHIIGNDWRGDKYGLFNHNPQKAFASLIDKISGKGTWENNPFVWVYEYEMIKNTDEL